MKKQVIAMVLILAVVAISFVSSNADFKSVSKERSDGMISFDLLDSYYVDTTNICDWFRIEKGTPFTWFFPFKAIERPETIFKEQYNLTIPNIEYTISENNRVLITRLVES